jgi:hypothetical protein
MCRLEGLSQRPQTPHGRGCGVGRTLGGGLGRGVGVGRIVAVGVAVGVDVGVGLGGGVTVAVAVGVGVGVPPPPWLGAWIETGSGPPVLKKKIPAALPSGGVSASNQKLYVVPQRIALAFGFVANVSVLHVTKKVSRLTSHGVLLNPASPTVPSFGQPGC